jgi:CheY-like chemotaxis protein/anti-sigma regulatory factor (Ser/Thr protein kinase)
LLAFGRKAQLSLKPVSPNVFVRSTSALLERLVGDEVQLQLDLASNLPQVRIDTVAMERALVNLVANARDAMPNGGIVRIQTSARRIEGAMKVELSVADEGIGIDDADRPYLFEPFFTTRAGAGGTGLGLATVLGTAEQHGGTVRVDKRTSGGSIFTIVLPALETTEQSEDASEPVDPQASKPDLRRLQLLVIDDDVRVADVLRRMLEHEGHAVYVATQPPAALEHWVKHGRDMDLVICDVAMASMRGPELMAHLAKHGPRPRVLYITGYSHEATLSTLGGPVLAKPFSSDALRRAIVAAIGP